MNRKLLSIILILIVATMTGCSTKQTNNQSNAQSQQPNESSAIKYKSNTESDNSTIKDTKTNSTSDAKATTNKVNLYNVIENTYKIANITIKYPQISNLGDDDKQSKINKLIKDSIIEGYDLTETIKTGVIPDYNEPIENLTMDVTYIIGLQNENMLSIEYLGEANMKNSAHPNNNLYTTNVDIANMKTLKLSDMFTIDQTLVNAFRNGTYIPRREDYKSEDIKILTENLKSEIYNYNNDKYMLTSLEQSDNHPIGSTNPGWYFSYLTKYGLVISTTVSHAGGDHAEFKIPYNALKYNIKTDNKALNNLLSSS